MAEKLCTLRTQGGGGGQKYTETSLWTNSAPTSDFAAQTVNLSDSIDNYKYIAIDYCFNKNNTGITSRAIYKVDDFKKALKDNNTNHNTIGINIEDSSNYGYSRIVFYVSSTSVAFSLGYRLGASSSSNAAISIPLEILGLNELKPGTDVGIVTSGASFSAKTSVSITCKVGDYIALGYSRSASGYNIYWNGTVLGQSSDYVTGYNLSTNNFMIIMKASQTSNTLSVASGATLTGGYQIFSLG